MILALIPAALMLETTIVDFEQEDGHGKAGK